MPTRRQALKTFMAAGAGAALTGLYTWRIEPHWLQFTYPALPIAGLHQQLAGKTLAQISDTHIGPRVDDDYIIDSFHRTQEQAPDFIVFTGDWISFGGHFAQFQKVIKYLPRGKLGTVGILGTTITDSAGARPLWQTRSRKLPVMPALSCCVINQQPSAA